MQALAQRIRAASPAFSDQAAQALWMIGYDADPVFDSVEAAEAAMQELREAFPHAPELTISIEEG